MIVSSRWLPDYTFNKTVESVLCNIFHARAAVYQRNHHLPRCLVMNKSMSSSIN